MKATFGLAAPIPFEVPAVHAIFTEESYKDFTIKETAPPKIVSYHVVALVLLLLLEVLHIALCLLMLGLNRQKFTVRI